MYKIGFAQVNYSIGPRSFGGYFLPYSVGVLISYLKQTGIKFEIIDILFKRDPINEAVKKLSQADVVAFSTYVWNKEYNYTLAKRLKELNSNIVTVFGGPELPVNDIQIFKKHPYIDIIVELEGEIAFSEIIKNLKNPTNLKNISGILINQNKIPIRGKSPNRIDHVDVIPSPYLTGVFDSLIKNFPNVKWAMTLETNRGCPYACTFCDWGSLTYSKIKKFDITRVLEEVSWAGKNSMYNLFLADANFGIFPERDNLILDHIIDTYKKYSYPKNIAINWAKNQKSSVVAMAKKLIEHGYSQGLTVSFQTLTDSVLVNIKRKNLALNQVEEVFDICRKNDVPVNTELILGLPGETLESWISNFYKLFRLNQKIFTVVQCQVLENSELNQLQRDEYHIKTVSSINDFPNAHDQEISETILLVSETKDLPFEDMVKANIWTWFFYTFHISGFTNFISEYLNRNNIVSYEEFYQNLFASLKLDKFFNEELILKEKLIRDWLSTGKAQCEVFQDIIFEGIRFNLTTVSKAHLDNTIKKHIQLIVRNYVSQYANDVIISNLIEFQETNLVDFYKINDYPISKSFKYDWFDYFINQNKLKEKDTKLTFNSKITEELIDVSPKNLVDYIFFRRKTLFGQTSISYKEENEQLQ